MICLRESLSDKCRWLAVLSTFLEIIFVQGIKIGRIQKIAAPSVRTKAIPPSIDGKSNLFESTAPLRKVINFGCKVQKETFQFVRFPKMSHFSEQPYYVNCTIVLVRVMWLHEARHLSSKRVYIFC